MVAGARHLVDRPPVAYAMAVQALCRTLFGVLTLAILLLYSHYFYSSYSSAIGGLGQIVVVGSIGAIAAAFITPYATRHLGGRGWVFAMTLLIAFTLPPLALPFVPALLVLSTFLGNISSQGIKIVVDTNVQVHCDEDFHGRVFSLEDTLFNFMFVVGLFIGALTLPDNGHSVGAVVAVSAGYLVLAVSYAWLTRRQPPLEARRPRRLSRRPPRDQPIIAGPRRRARPATTGHRHNSCTSLPTPRQRRRSAPAAPPGVAVASLIVDLRRAAAIVRDLQDRHIHDPCASGVQTHLDRAERRRDHRTVRCVRAARQRRPACLDRRAATALAAALATTLTTGRVVASGAARLRTRGALGALETDQYQRGDGAAGDATDRGVHSSN